MSICMGDIGIGGVGYFIGDDIQMQNYPDLH